MKTTLVWFLLAAVGGGSAYYWFAGEAAAHVNPFRTIAVKRGDLTVSISATGTIEPEEVVDVGAQVAGRIVAFGKVKGGNEAIDYGSQVEPGTVLALIDDALYQEEVNQAEATLSKNRARVAQMKAQVNEGLANIERAEADLKQLVIAAEFAERNLVRGRELIAARTISNEELDTRQSAYDTAQAAVAVGRAAIAQARSVLETRKAAVEETKADVVAAEAALNRARKNLGYTTIQSPIEGVIIDRRVNIGQTVVASLNAPSLFLIAKDLKRLEVWASVNEADIGRIRPGQPVTFTVDTLAGEKFQGTVGQIRLNASMAQNVVTYTVVVAADNREGKLLPYLTANLLFETAKVSGGLLVPNSVLRWKPRPEQIDPAYRDQVAAAGKQTTLVWTPVGSYVRPIEVRVGLGNGTLAEISGRDLSDGTELVLGESSRGGDSQLVNPLAPNVYRGTPKSGAGG